MENELKQILKDMIDEVTDLELLDLVCKLLLESARTSKNCECLHTRIL